MKANVCGLLIMLLFAVSCSTPSRNRGGADVLDDRVLELPAVTNFAGDVYVDFNSRGADYQKLAVLPFKSAVEQAGVAVSDFFTTELLKTARYELIERSQMETVLKEQELRLSGVIEDKMAAQLGKVLGVHGVVVGTISEYGVQRSGFSTVPSIGLSVRMIDSTTGKIVWSVSHSLVGKSGTSLSQHAKEIVEEMVVALSRAWLDAGDVRAAGIPPAVGLSATGLVRKVVLSWVPHMSVMAAGYEILRREPGGEEFLPVIRLKNRRQGRMSYEDGGLTDLSQYSYEIRTVSRYGLCSAQSARIEVITAGPPAVPAKLQAEGNRIRQVPLAWEESADPTVVGYVIVRQAAGGPEVKVVRLEGRRVVSYVDRGSGRREPLADNMEYTYRIKSFNEAGVESELSPPVKAATKPAPARVAGVKAVSGLPKSVAVSWTAGPAGDEIAGYVIFRSDSATGTFEEIGRVTGAVKSEYIDRRERRHEVKNGTTYYYKVAAYNTGDVAGAQSDAVSATTKPAPVRPGAPTASAGQVRQVTLAWPRCQGADLVTVLVYRAREKGGRMNELARLPVETVEYVDRALGDGVTYWYQLAVVDRDGLESDASDAVEGRTKPSPAPPVDLLCDTQGGVFRLSWTSSTSPDVEKYVIYLHTFMSMRKLDECRDNTFTARNLAPGSYKFSVAAVDKDGLESSRSAIVKGVLGN